MMKQCRQLYITCHNCDLLIRDKSNVNAYDVLKGKVDALTEELGNSEKANETLKQQVSTLTSHQTSLQSLLEERESALHETEAKIVSIEHQSEDKKLREKIADLEKEAAGQEMKIKMQGGIIQHMKAKEKDTVDKSQNISDIDAKLEAFSVGILSKVTEIMDKKLNTKITTTPGETGDIQNAPAMWSEVVSSQPRSMKKVMLEARNDEKIEESEKQRRANNLIIHGVMEGAAGEGQDENFIKAFLDAIEVDVAPKQIIRIGSKSADKKRPVKVILNNADDKEKIMSNLRKLKDADDNIRGISVREDYTQEERKLIQAMHEEAKRKNEADNVTHWKVRGTPKNGLRVVRITTRN